MFGKRSSIETYYFSFTGISLSIAGGSNLLNESPNPYQFCVTLSEPPNGADLTVSIAPSGFATATCELIKSKITLDNDSYIPHVYSS